MLILSFCHSAGLLTAPRAECRPGPGGSCSEHGRPERLSTRKKLSYPLISNNLEKLRSLPLAILGHEKYRKSSFTWSQNFLRPAKQLFSYWMIFVLSFFHPVCQWNFGGSSRVGREPNHNYRLTRRHVAVYGETGNWLTFCMVWR